MQVSSSNNSYQISSALLVASSDSGASNSDDGALAFASFVSDSKSTSTASTTTSSAPASIFPSTSTLSTSPAQIDSSFSQIPTTPGQPSEALGEAFSRGVVNPLDWLTQSDIDLIEKTTGVTVKNGEFYREDGDTSNYEAARALSDSLFHMRNYGTMSLEGQPKVIVGTITAEDLDDFINFCGGFSQSGLQALQMASDFLKSEEA